MSSSRSSGSKYYAPQDDKKKVSFDIEFEPVMRNDLTGLSKKKADLVESIKKCGLVDDHLDDYLCHVAGASNFINETEKRIATLRDNYNKMLDVVVKKYVDIIGKNFSDRLENAHKDLNEYFKVIGDDDKVERFEKICEKIWEDNDSTEPIQLGKNVLGSYEDEMERLKNKEERKQIKESDLVDRFRHEMHKEKMGRIPTDFTFEQMQRLIRNDKVLTALYQKIKAHETKLRSMSVEHSLCGCPVEMYSIVELYVEISRLVRLSLSELCISGDIFSFDLEDKISETIDHIGGKLWSRCYDLLNISSSLTVRQGVNSAVMSENQSKIYEARCRIVRIASFLTGCEDRTSKAELEWLHRRGLLEKAGKMTSISEVIKEEETKEINDYLSELLKNDIGAGQ